MILRESREEKWESKIFEIEGILDAHESFFSVFYLSCSQLSQCLSSRLMWVFRSRLRVSGFSHFNPHVIWSNFNIFSRKCGIIWVTKVVVATCEFYCVKSADSMKVKESQVAQLFSVLVSRWKSGEWRMRLEENEMKKKTMQKKKNMRSITYLFFPKKKVCVSLEIFVEIFWQISPKLVWEHKKKLIKILRLMLNEMH